MNIHEDINYWTTLKWPAAPNIDDYRFFEQECDGRVLLLGSTKLLLPLATEAWDVNPKYSDSKLKNRDWFSIDEYWDTIILDGGLSFGKEFCNNLLLKVLPNCSKFVVRAFLNPSWITKYAVYFPRVFELSPQPLEYPINNIYTFYIWNKNQQY